MDIKSLLFWTLPIVLFLFKTQRFGDWILSPSSGGTYLGTSYINWAQLSRFHLKTKTEYSPRNVVFKIKTGWIISRNTIIVLIYHHHKHFDLIYKYYYLGE
jgi:hypothetical protein